MNEESPRHVWLAIAFKFSDIASFLLCRRVVYLHIAIDSAGILKLGGQTITPSKSHHWWPPPAECSGLAWMWETISYSSVYTCRRINYSGWGAFETQTERDILKIHIICLTFSCFRTIGCQFFLYVSYRIGFCRFCWWEKVSLQSHQQTLSERMLSSLAYKNVELIRWIGKKEIIAGLISVIMKRVMQKHFHFPFFPHVVVVLVWKMRA